MAGCLICGATVEEFVSFGRMPIANGFVTPEQFDGEPRYALTAGFCPACTMVQLVEPVDRERMFHERYAFYSSTSARMAAHFRALSEQVRARHLASRDPFVVEIGSNDGILLRHFADAGIRHLGIEPSANVAQAAVERGVRTVSRFFDEALAADVVDEHGHADVVLGANVMCHLPYLHSVLSGIRRLLAPAGVLIFEDPYLGDIVEKTSYDQIYDEHAFYFSVSSLTHALAPHGLEIVDVQPQGVHGGSMRHVVGHAGAHPVSPAVARRRLQEAQLGLHRAETFHALRRRIEASRDALVDLLQSLRARGKRIVGYGATSKSTTVINYCGLTGDLVEFISDTTPIKQGRFSPGAHIPVRGHEEFAGRYPDYALLFAWNHGEEIMAKEQAFVASGGRFIAYVPTVGVV